MRANEKPPQKVLEMQSNMSVLFIAPRHNEEQMERLQSHCKTQSIHTLTISKASVSQAASKFMSRKDTLNTFSSPSRANLMLL